MSYHPVFCGTRRQGGFVVFSVIGDDFSAAHDGSQSDGALQPGELSGYQRAAFTAVER